MTLDTLMDPEMDNRTQIFYVIQEYLKRVPQTNILEIGGGGGGSTEAIMKGLLSKKDTLITNNIKFATIELSTTRCNFLKDKYKDISFYYPYNTSSVPVNTLPSEEYVASFIKQTGIHGGNVEEVLKWLREDIKYAKEKGFENVNGIQKIKDDFKVKTFSFVLLDSGEFCSNAEYEELQDCDAYCLDDINVLKNWHVHRKLLNDPRYVLLFEDKMRGGSSLFCKKEIKDKYFL